ncbi:uncharacterized protein FFM5_15366 [Fusarium fujikuroi]|nr:uncharacterized protein FFM5_15366 [Fusarium fujikuroi]
MHNIPLKVLLEIPLLN